MSNYITKDLAKFVASKMIDKMQQNIELKKLQVSEKVVADINKTLPKELLEIALKYPNYFKKCNRILLQGNGLNDSFSLNKSVLATGNYHQIAFKPEPEDAKIISKGINEIEKLEKKYKELRIQIEKTLLNLKTFKRIETQFPEAWKFVPENKTENSLAVPIEDLRKQLNHI